MTRSRILAEALRFGARTHFLIVYSGHVDVDVDPIQQWP
jgi:hypothetical protein